MKKNNSFKYVLLQKRNKFTEISQFVLTNQKKQFKIILAFAKQAQVEIWVISSGGRALDF